MNIRNLISQIVSPIDRLSPRAGVKAGTASDRDPNGRREKDEAPPRTITDEELKKLTEHIEQLPAIADGTLTYSLAGEKGHRLLIITDQKGDVVKRYTENDFEALLNSQERKTGKLFNRAM